MSHEKIINEFYTEDGMICVRPSLGKYANENTSSFVQCLAEFDTYKEADEFTDEWSEASHSKEVRRYLLDKHALDHPEWYRLSGPMRENYINYYHSEAEKVKDENNVR